MRRIGPRAILLKTTIIGTRNPHSKPNKQIVALAREYNIERERKRECTRDRTRDRGYDRERDHEREYNKVLDIGCGNGRHFIFPLTIGVDADVRILRITKEKGICLCGDGQNLPFRPGIFDLSLFSYSLEYMMDPDRAREEGRRVSRETYELIYAGYYSWERVHRRQK